jgi:4-hydroxybenzoate polyprenyltransferase/Tfp pilus assembly protein PilF
MRGRVLRFLDRLERTRAPPVLWVASLLCIILIRALLELALEYPTSGLLKFWFHGLQGGVPPTSLSAYASNTAMVLLHWPGFYAAVFLALTLGLSLLAGERLLRTARAVLLFFPILWLPPALDAVLTGGRGYLLEYNLELDFLALLTSLYRPDRDIPGVSHGIRVEIFLASLGAILYVFAKTRSVVRGVLGGAVTTLVPLVAGSWPGWMTRSALVPTALPGELHGRLGLAYLLMLVVLGALWGWRASPDTFRAALSNLRWLRASHYGLMAGLGIVLARYELDDTRVLFPEVLLPGAGVILAIVFAFQFNVQVNDLVDRDVDQCSNPERPLARRALTEAQLLWLAALYLGLSLAFAAAVHATAFLLVLCYNALGLLYSAPPFQLRRFFLTANLLLAACSLVAMVAGFSVLTGADALLFFPRRAVLLLLVAFVAAFNFKDVKDVEGDSAAGHATLPVLLGRARGRQVVAALMVAAYCSIPLILDRGGLLWTAPLFGLATAYVIVRGPRPNEPALFGLYFAYAGLLTAVLISSPGPRALPAANLGYFHMLHGRTGAALAAFEADSALTPADRDVGMAMVHLAEGDTAPAVERAAAAARVLSEPDVKLLHAYALAADRNVEAAERVYRELIASHPKSPVAHFNLGTLDFGRGEYARAEEHFRAALEDRPEWGEAHFNLGNSLLKMTRAGEAEAEYRRALLHMPRSANLHNNLGIALERQGRKDEALREFTRALGIEPRMQLAEQNRRRLLDGPPRQVSTAE